MPYNLGEILKDDKIEFDFIGKKRIFLQIVKAVEHLHSRMIMHRDIKPDNIFIDVEGNTKLGDFNLARSFQLPLGKYTHEVTTLYYRAPEILLGTTEYATGIDIWSLGCILAELFTGKTLFASDSEIGQLYKIFETLGTPSEDRWPGVSQLKDYQIIFPFCREIIM